MSSTPTVHDFMAASWAYARFQHSGGFVGGIVAVLLTDRARRGDLVPVRVEDIDRAIETLRHTVEGHGLEDVLLADRAAVPDSPDGADGRPVLPGTPTCPAVGISDADGPLRAMLAAGRD